MIHATAIIDPAANLAEDVEVGAYSIIGADVTIEAGTVVGPHVVINGPTTIGKSNHFFQFSSIGEDPQDLKYAGERTELIIGDHNTFRECTTVHRGTVTGISKTVIGNHGLFMAYVHIAHDCVIGDNVIFSNNASLAGHAEIGNHVTLAGFSMVHQFGRIGDHAFGGMACGLNRDLPPYVLAAGCPARAVAINKIGLKRRGFNSDTISALHKCFRLMFKSPDKNEKELEQLSSMHPEVEQLVTFVKKSERGVVQ